MIEINFVLGIAIYGLIWFVVLFMVLPFGVRPQKDTGHVTPGTAESAPIKPNIMRKFVVTALISALVYGLIHWLLVSERLMRLLPNFDG